MFCKRCGRELKEGANFCPGCGEATRQEPQHPSGEPVVASDETFDAKKREEALMNAPQMVAPKQYQGPAVAPPTIPPAKKPKKAKIVAVGILAALLVAGAITLVVVMTSGGGGNKGKAKQTVQDYWSAMQNGDYTMAKTYLSGALSTTTLDAVTNSKDWKCKALLFGDIMKSTSIEIGDSSVSGNNATVNVKLTMPNMAIKDLIDASLRAQYPAFSNSNSGAVFAFADQDFITAFNNQLPQIINNTPKATKQVQLSLVLENGNWRINTDMFGDLLNSIAKAM